MRETSSLNRELRMTVARDGDGEKSPHHTGAPATDGVWSGVERVLCGYRSCGLHGAMFKVFHGSREHATTGLHQVGPLTRCTWAYLGRCPGMPLNRS